MDCWIVGLRDELDGSEGREDNFDYDYEDEDEDEDEPEDDHATPVGGR
jgi:hypothetical protein